VGRKEETIIEQQTKVTPLYEFGNNFKAMEINVLVKQNLWNTIFWNPMWID